MATDAMTILYGKDGTGGVAGHIREETTKTIHNYLGNMSIEEVLDILSEISETDDFPDLVIDWFDLIENYIEARHQSE
ncbi:MAG TPA: hypothetical protein EYM57_07035 [Gammaproteobacteria bacterium]|jgi:replicative superfamily II helicase|nr:hypothetical protein [Gammaproteobacteria bacterium]PHS02995.1 MAG: hypothetical protein COA89_17340 [Acidithiobacillus sp.]HAD36438.1 hypothetical protein [Gammaproteobacteria bacterium]HBK75970.1 hypothetical protein [Gammaproteobacteria bacterium]HIM88590.1 hypothetical protein [Gammaproteobacteria bacterium]